MRGYRCINVRQSQFDEMHAAHKLPTECLIMLSFSRQHHPKLQMLIADFGFINRLNIKS